LSNKLDLFKAPCPIIKMLALRRARLRYNECYYTTYHNVYVLG
jgi:hypothetical protein